MPAFFFNDTATTEIYTLSLHDALPISSTGLRTWRVDTQRFSTWKYSTIFGLEAMSPTPTTRPETATTRNNTIKNWTSNCHVKLLYAPMSPPILNRLAAHPRAEPSRETMSK